MSKHLLLSTLSTSLTFAPSSRRLVQSATIDPSGRSPPAFLCMSITIIITTTTIIIFSIMVIVVNSYHCFAQPRCHCCIKVVLSIPLPPPPSPSLLPSHEIEVEIDRALFLIDSSSHNATRQLLGSSVIDLVLVLPSVPPYRHDFLYQ